MKTFIIGAVAALAAMATPAMAADFTGPRVSVVTGLDKQAGENGVSYGVSAGYDFRLVGPVRVGGEVTVADASTDLPGVDSNLDLSASARVGVKVAGPVLAFAKAGYVRTNYNVLGTTFMQEGVRFGGGVEVALTDRVFATAEYARTEYGNGVPGRDQGLVGLGFRF